MAKIAVDIDDTLYRFRDIAKDALFHLAQERDDKNILSAAYTEALQWRTLADVAGNEILAEAIELAHTPEIMLNQRPFPGAPETCQGLYEDGHELIYISNRSEDSSDATEQWLEINNFPYSYNLKCLWGDKIPHLTDCQYIIDDRVSTLVRFTTDCHWRELKPWRSLQRKGFGIHAPHNTNLTDMENVYLAPTWSALNYYLVRKEVLSSVAYDPFEVLEGVT